MRRLSVEKGPLSAAVMVSVRNSDEINGELLWPTVKSRGFLGKEATYVALDAGKYPPVHISEVDSSADGSDGAAVMEKLPAPVK